MDVEVLIAEVFKKPALWDKRNKYYSNRNTTERKWKEVAEKMTLEGKINNPQKQNILCILETFIFHIYNIKSKNIYN